MGTAILYYSFTGNTRKKAQALAKTRNADLIEVKELQNRSKAGAYITGSLAAMRQKCSKLQPFTCDYDAYDTIIIMAPVWAGNIAPAANSIIAGLPQGKQVEIVAVSASGKSSTAEKIPHLVAQQGCSLVSVEDVR